LLLLQCAAVFPIAAQSPSLRSFDEIFPSVSTDIRQEVFSQDGYFNEAASRQTILATGSRLAEDLASAVFAIRPRVLVESVMVIPGGHSLLDIYNALSKIRNLRGRTYYSQSKGANVPLFEDATRLDGAGSSRAVGDPPLSSSVPASEVIYMRLKDANFGNTYYRAQMGRDTYGLRLNMTNSRDISFLLFPAIREGMFVAQMYFEPIAEGVLVYSLAGVEVSDFVASRIHMPSAIEKRLAVIIGWATDGIRSRQTM